MNFRRILLAGACILALGACRTMTPKSIGQDDPFLGEAVKYNAAVQTINPDPIYPEDAAEPGSMGVKGANAVRRYRTDQVNARHQAGSQAARGLSTTGGSGGPQ